MDFRYSPAPLVRAKTNFTLKMDMGRRLVNLFIGCGISLLFSLPQPPIEKILTNKDSKHFMNVYRSYQGESVDSGTAVPGTC